MKRLAAASMQHDRTSALCVYPRFSSFTVCLLMASSTQRNQAAQLAVRAAQRFSLLGSTGSIGTQTLDIVREQPDRFEIVALAAGGNLDLLAEQAWHALALSPRIDLYTGRAHSWSCFMMYDQMYAQPNTVRSSWP